MEPRPCRRGPGVPGNHAAGSGTWGHSSVRTGAWQLGQQSPGQRVLVVSLGQVPSALCASGFLACGMLSVPGS